MHELPELGEVLAHQREVVLVVEAADPQDPVAPVPVAEPAAERVAGVGRVGDQRVVAQRVGDLLEQPRLRVVGVDVEVAGHRVSGPALRGLGGGLEVAAQLRGQREDQRLLGAVHGLGVGVAALGEEAPARPRPAPRARSRPR